MRWGTPLVLFVKTNNNNIFQMENELSVLTYAAWAALIVEEQPNKRAALPVAACHVRGLPGCWERPEWHACFRFRDLARLISRPKSAARAPPATVESQVWH
jgi:hypothetical protein